MSFPQRHEAEPLASSVMPPAEQASQYHKASQRHRVLLIYDQPMIGEAVRRLIAGESDIAFEFCRDADAALDAANRFLPTVILQDLVMPGIEGLDMVRRFRSVSATANVPVIVLSAKEEPAVKAEMLTNGASDYLVKLPDRVELLARLRVHSEGFARLLERNAAFQALETSLADLEREKERSEKLLLFRFSRRRSPTGSRMAPPRSPSRFRRSPCCLPTSAASLSFPRRSSRGSC